MSGKYNGRRLDFRFPTEAERAGFHQEAFRHGCTDCKLVLHLIDEYFHRDVPKPTSAQDTQDLKEEVSRLTKALREADRLTAVHLYIKIEIALQRSRLVDTLARPRVTADRAYSPLACVSQASCSIRFLLAILVAKAGHRYLNDSECNFSLELNSRDLLHHR